MYLAKKVYIYDNYNNHEVSFLLHQNQFRFTIRIWLIDLVRFIHTWSYFKVINHGVRPELMAAAREAWRSFFHLPVEAKEAYSNSPSTYEGYGSRLGVEKGALLDWNDYYFLNFLPLALKDLNKWPSLPSNIR